MPAATFAPKSARNRCAYCHGSRWGRSVSAHEHQYGLAGEFVYDQCAQCEALLLRNPPADLTSYYPADRYYSYGGPMGGLRGFLQRSATSWEIARVNPVGALTSHIVTATGATGLHYWLKMAGVGPNARVLDVGCGSGGLLRAMARVGFRSLTGIDPFVPAEVAGQPVRVLRQGLERHTGIYDFVMLHHVLEHVADPAATLGHVRAHLAPGGHALVRVPIVPSEAWERWGANWVQLDAPRHQTIPSERGLVSAAERTGLALLESAHDSTAFQFWGSAWCASGRLLSEASVIRWWSKRRGALYALRVNRARRGDQAAFLFQAV